MHNGNKAHVNYGYLKVSGDIQNLQIKHYRLYLLQRVFFHLSLILGLSLGISRGRRGVSWSLTLDCWNGLNAELSGRGRGLNVKRSRAPACLTWHFVLNSTWSLREAPAEQPCRPVPWFFYRQNTNSSRSRTSPRVQPLSPRAVLLPLGGGVAWVPWCILPSQAIDHDPAPGGWRGGHRMETIASRCQSVVALDWCPSSEGSAGCCLSLDSLCNFFLTTYSWKHAGQRIGCKPRTKALPRSSAAPRLLAAQGKLLVSGSPLPERMIFLLQKTVVSMLLNNSSSTNNIASPV